MKKITLFLFLFFSLIQFSNAQTENNHEIGIRLSGLDDIDFIYKKYLEEDKLVRLRFANLGFRHDRIPDNSNRTAVSFGFAVGREKRKAINEKFDFVIGHEFQLSTNINNAGNGTTAQLRGGIGLVLGFNYEINQNFNVGLETIPSFSYSTTFGDAPKIHSFDLGFSTSAANLLFTYKF